MTPINEKSLTEFFELDAKKRIESFDKWQGAVKANPKNEIERFLNIRKINIDQWLAKTLGWNLEAANKKLAEATPCKMRKERAAKMRVLPSPIDLTFFPSYNLTSKMCADVRRLNANLEIFEEKGELGIKELAGEKSSKEPVYFLTIPFCPGHDEEKALQRLNQLIELLFKELFAMDPKGKNDVTESSKKEVAKRVCILLGINKPASYDMEENGRFFQWARRIPLLAGIRLKLISTTWQVSYDVPFEGCFSLRTAYQIVKNIHRIEFPKSDFKDAWSSRKAVKDDPQSFRKQIPFQHIRQWILNALRKDHALLDLIRRRTSFLGVMDDDAVSLRLDGKGPGILRRMDELAALEKDRSPQLVSFGYFGALNEPNEIQLALILDMLYRQELSRIFPTGVYYPEPGLFVHLDEHILKALSFLGGQNQEAIDTESRWLVASIREYLLPLRTYFLAERYLMTTIPVRIAELAKSRELTLVELGHKESLSMYAAVSQSHLNHNVRGANLNRALNHRTENVKVFGGTLKKVFDPFSLPNLAVMLAGGDRYQNIHFQNALQLHRIWVSVLLNKMRDSKQDHHKEWVEALRQLQQPSFSEENGNKEYAKQSSHLLQDLASRLKAASDGAESIAKKIRAQRKILQDMYDLDAKNASIVSEALRKVDTLLNEFTGVKTKTETVMKTDLLKVKIISIKMIDKCSKEKDLEGLNALKSQLEKQQQALEGKFKKKDIAKKGSIAKKLTSIKEGIDNCSVKSQAFSKKGETTVKSLDKKLEKFSRMLLQINRKLELHNQGGVANTLEAIAKGQLDAQFEILQEGRMELAKMGLQDLEIENLFLAAARAENAYCAVMLAHVQTGIDPTITQVQFVDPFLGPLTIPLVPRLRAEGSLL